MSDLVETNIVGFLMQRLKLYLCKDTYVQDQSKRSCFINKEGPHPFGPKKIDGLLVPPGKV